MNQGVTVSHGCCVEISHVMLLGSRFKGYPLNFLEIMTFLHCFRETRTSSVVLFPVADILVRVNLHLYMVRGVVGGAKICVEMHLPSVDWSRHRLMVVSL